MAQQPSNEAAKGDAPKDTAMEKEPYLGNWKTREQAQEGLDNMQKLLDSQGNELGSLRKQSELMQSRMDMQQPQEAAPEAKPKEQSGPDYDKEMAKIEKLMSELDQDESDYQAQLGKLVSQSNAITAEAATQKALDAAQAHFSETLDKRDVQDMQRKFKEQNPDFESPDMQMAINEFMANDPTGMHDQMSAYFAIKEQGAGQGLTEAQTRIAELEERLNIAGGQNDVGKVVTKSQAPRQPTNKTKATGADLDRGMMEALQKVA
jgi:hypothetical protein